MNAKVDQFVKQSDLWPEEIVKLRSLLLKTSLDEEFKWGLPCYSFDGKNIVIIQPFKASLALMFFKGTLLKDSKKLLVANGPNSNASRRFEFHSVQDITKMAGAIKAYIKEAIAVEESGLKVEVKRKPSPMPAELTAIFAKKPKFKKAFESLTPGRQRAYILHFAGAKQAATRVSRIEKHMDRILAGKGLMD